MKNKELLCQYKECLECYLKQCHIHKDVDISVISETLKTIAENYYKDKIDDFAIIEEDIKKKFYSRILGMDTRFPYQDPSKKYISFCTSKGDINIFIVEVINSVANKILERFDDFRAGLPIDRDGMSQKDIVLLLEKISAEITL